MSVNQSKPINVLAIRDTSAHESDVVFNGEFVIKTLVIENLLNQTVTFQCQGSANSDFSNPFNIGSSWDVAASTNTYMTCETYIPYWRIVATCSVAPASGSLTVIVFGVNG
jgi:hypothetical protein